jgi:NAD(P)-dependent dehydrogenase (short-subunit alcohol dehydrogenase family)
VGRATARAFAREGASVALIARGLDGLNGAAADVESLGGTPLVLPLDVSDPASLEAAAQQVEDTLGPIDVWVNNAMTSVFSPVREMTPDEYKRVTEVTYLGYVYATLAALRRMTPRNRGVIIQVGSALAFRGIPLQSAYCGAKHAIQGFTESLRAELLHDKLRIRVPMVHLPAMNTPQFDWVKSRLPHRAQPVPPIFQPEVAAAAILWMSHHPHRHHLYVGWPTLKTIWGNRLVPWYVDRYLAAHGYDAQQTDQPEDPDRRDNLWAPLSGDHGPHGRFGRRASSISPYTWTTKHRVALGLAAAGAAGAALTLLAGARKPWR